ncbi:MAG: lipid-A-disaccharide synthase [Xanthomonadales bacterium]|nr:lipid-A-disaccharide synthase [Xanthomonadales bacterium]
MSAPTLIVLVAGETSGDQLGGALMRELRALVPNVQFAGVGGPHMRDQGLDCWWDSEELAVMGLAEVLSHLPRLLKLRRALREKILSHAPALFVGVDSPDFNLGLEITLKRREIPTVHYVSPTVWAWRQKRVHKIARATNLVMCLFPFERDFFTGHGVEARYTGHPMADEIEMHTDRQTARRQLGLDPDRPCIALLPGSRRGEVGRLADHLLGAADILAGNNPQMQFVAPMAGDGVHQLFETASVRYPGVHCTLLRQQARQAIAASDLVLCASGTATLETMLIKRPMVVVYRFSHVTYVIGKSLRLMKSRFFSLPNILAGDALVPELEQYQVNAERIASEAQAWLADPARTAAVMKEFESLHRRLRKDASKSAAQAVAGLLDH